MITNILNMHNYIYVNYLLYFIWGKQGGCELSPHDAGTGSIGISEKDKNLR